jgi:hypothetical protein
VFEQKKIKLILSLIAKGCEYKASKAFYNLAIATLIITILIEIIVTNLTQIERIRSGVVLFISLLSFLLLFYLILNEIRKITSYWNILSLIDNMSNGRSDLGKFESNQNIKELHPVVISHPVTMYLFGYMFSREGHSKEGNYLIDKAKAGNSEIAKINSAGLAPKEFYLLKQLLTDEKKFKIDRVFLELWHIKPFRYLFVILIILAILLHSL